MMEGLEEEDCAEESPEDLLFEAVQSNDLAQVVLLVSLPDFNINVCNITQKRALYFAIEMGKPSLVKTLVKYGADVNATSFCGTHSTFETPLVTAARSQQKEIVEFLLQKGCVIDHYRGCREGKSALQWATCHGDIEMCKLLLASGADLNYMGPHRHTALHYAVLKDNAEMAKWLIEQGIELTVNGDGRSALHIASVRGNLAIVKELIAHGSDVELMDSFDFTPFSLACLRGHLSIIHCLMDNDAARTQQALDDGLLKASECGHLSTLRFLLEKHANVNAKNVIGETALSIAARGQFKSAKFLLENGAVITVVDKRGYTPLQHAVLREQVDIASLLIQHGADLHASSNTTDSPLHISCSISNAMLIKCLLDAGCDLKRESWFGAHVIQEKLGELDYQRSIRFHRQSSRQKEVWEWLAERLQRPPTLLEATRVSLRQHLLQVSEGTSILCHIQKLKLPPLLKKYISLDDMYYV